MTFKVKLVAGLATSLATLLLVAFLSYSSLVRNIEDNRWVTHTHLVLEKLDALQIHLTDAETGERGYILTGLESYLPPYQDAYALVEQSLHSLRELTADNPVQQHSLDGLEPLVGARLGELQDRIGLRKKAGLAASAAAVAGGAREPLMDEIRVLIATMKQEEDRLLVQRSSGSQASSRRTTVILVIGDALGFLFLSVAGLVIQQEMVRRARAEEEVRLLNKDLERRVAERTEE